MENRDYLRAMGRRVWVLILLPVLAAVAAAGFIEKSPPERGSTAVVFAHPTSASSGSTVQYVTSFQAALTSDAVVGELSGQTGISRSHLSSGLSSAPSAPNSITMDVTYQGTQKIPVVERVAVLAARDTLQLLTQPQLAVFSSQLAAAQQSATTAQQALVNYEHSTGLYVPTQYYQAVAGQLAQLRVIAAEQTAGGTHPGSLSVIDSSIATTIAELQKMGPEVAQAQALGDAQSRAVGAVQTAQNDLASIRQEVAAINAPGAVTPGTAKHVSRLKKLIKVAGPAAVVAFVIAVGIVALLENRRARRAAAAGPPAGGPGRTDAAGVAQPVAAPDPARR